LNISSDENKLIYFEENPIGRVLNTNLVVNQKKRCIVFETLEVASGVTVAVHGTLEVI
jgi:hypothetical protein